MRNILFLFILFLFAFGFIGCDRPPQVGGTLTVQVANFSDAIPDEVFAAGLAYIQQQLAGHTGGVTVVLVPATTGRMTDGYGIILRPGARLEAELDEDAKTIFLTIPAGYDPKDGVWREVLKEKIKESL